MLQVEMNFTENEETGLPNSLFQDYDAIFVEAAYRLASAHPDKKVKMQVYTHPEVGIYLGGILQNVPTEIAIWREEGRDYVLNFKTYIPDRDYVSQTKINLQRHITSSEDTFERHLKEVEDYLRMKLPI